MRSEIAGFILLGLVDAFRRIDVLSGEEASRLAQDIEPEQWYPLSRFFHLFDSLRIGKRDVAPILFRAGIEFITKWYTDGPGHTFIDSGVGFLRYQAGSEGYSSVVRGPSDEIGGVELLELDESTGLARIRSTNPFPAQFDRGVFYGGVVAPGDMDWVAVSAEQSGTEHMSARDFEVRFRRQPDPEHARKLEELLATPPTKQGVVVPDELVPTLYWRHRDLRLRYENDVAFHEGVSALLRDTTRELAESEGRLRRIAENAPDAIFRLSLPERRLEFISAASESVFGASPKELLATPELVEEMMGSGLRTAEADHARDATAQQSEYPIRHRRTGERRWIQLRTLLVRDADGRPTAVEGLASDVTQRRRAEEVHRRSKDAAEAANRAKSAFIANTSHEVRTPMNAIVGFTELALRSDVPPEVRDYLRKIRTSSQSLLNLLNDIIDISVLEAEKIAIETKTFDLRDLLEQIGDENDVLAARSGLELVLEIDDTVPESMCGDRQRVWQILTNLTSNAIKFTSKGEVAISARVLESDAERITIELAVSDTGRGIGAAYFPSLFEPFTQEDSSTTRKRGGSGLGLTICKRLADLMGGIIEVESRVGEGTTFKVTLPFERDEQSTQGTSVDVADALQGRRVLVVEPHPRARTVLESILSRLSFSVDAIGNSEGIVDEVTAAAATHPYSLVFFAADAPGLWPSELVSRLKDELRERERPKIVVMTRTGDEVDKSARARGADGLLLKPATSRAVMRALQELTRGGAESVPTQREPETADALRLDGARVLIVEDIDINQEILQVGLSAAGAETEVAPDGHQALDVLATSHFDAVLMDVQMPGMDGLETTKRIRADARYRNLPIVAMTAHAMKGDREACIAAGMDDYVTKPVDLEQLLQVLTNHVIHQTSAGRELPAHIDGFDLGTAIERVGHNRELLSSLLNSFVARYEHVVAEIRDALDAGDTILASQLAHTVKGVAGNLGAIEVAKHARQLEALVRDGRGLDEPTVVQHLEGLQNAISNAVAALRVAGLRERSIGGASTPSEGTPPGVSRDELENLATLLEGNRLDAKDHFEALRPRLAGSLSSDALVTLQRQIDQLDYDNALASIGQVLEQQEREE